MTAEQFAYWLRGFTELTADLPSPSPAQWKAIQEHLATVFVKVTPPVMVPQTPLVPGIATPRLEDYLRKFPMTHTPVITC